MLVRFFVRFAAYPVALSLLIAGVAIAPGMPMPMSAPATPPVAAPSAAPLNAAMIGISTPATMESAA